MKFLVNLDWISMGINDFFLHFSENFRKIFLNIEIECIPIQNTNVLLFKILFKWIKKSLKSA